jgi:hypothetical protein
VFLSADARLGLADYLKRERAGDASGDSAALFRSAMNLSARAADGRLSPQAINLLLEQIGCCHDAEVSEPGRKLAPLRPPDQRSIERYTTPPEAVAARYVEEF